MAEIPVAFPNDEVSAEEIAALLRAAGIPARVDRGLHGSWQVPSQGQMTVFVNAKDGARAHRVLGTTVREEDAPGPATRVVVAILIGAVVLGIIAIAVTLLSRPPDFRPFVMSIEEWSSSRSNYPDGRTVGGTAVYRLEYHRRDHWTLTLVSDDLGAGTPGEGSACRNGTSGSVGADGAFRGVSSDRDMCNGIARWIRPGMACCYPWKKEIADGLVTYTDPGERVVFDLGTGLPVLYEAGKIGGAVGQRTVYRLERWLAE